MNVADYIASLVESCSDVETSVLRDMTAKYLGADYEGSWKVFGVPVSVKDKSDVSSVKLQLFYVKALDGATKENGVITAFDGNEIVEPIASNAADYAATEAELFEVDLREFLDAKITAGAILKYNIEKADADDEFAIVTAYILFDSTVSASVFFVYRYDGGDFSFYPYGA